MSVDSCAVLDPALIYDTLFPIHTDYIDFVYKEIGSSGSILEFGSGTGRLAIPLARNGVSVTGVDYNERYVECARGKAVLQNLSEKCNFIVSDFSEFGSSERFSAGLMSSNTLSLVSDPIARLNTFRCLSRCLVDGASLLVILMNTARLLAEGPTRSTQRTGKLHCGTELSQYEEREYDFLSSNWVGTNTLTIRCPDGEQFVSYEEISHAAILTQDLILTAIAANFKLDKVYGDFDRSPLGPRSTRAIYLFRKEKHQ